MQLSNIWYDRLKWVAQILLPALATFYFAFAAIWNLPYAEQIVGTITAIDALLGVLLGLSSKSYTQTANFPAGTLLIDKTNPEMDKYRLEIDKIEDLANKKSINLIVNSNADLSDK